MDLQLLSLLVTLGIGVHCYAPGSEEPVKFQAERPRDNSKESSQIARHWPQAYCSGCGAALRSLGAAQGDHRIGDRQVTGVC